MCNLRSDRGKVGEGAKSDNTGGGGIGVGHGRSCRREVGARSATEEAQVREAVAEQGRFSARAEEVKERFGYCGERVGQLPATRPHLGLLSPTSYAHSGFKLELWRNCAPQAEFTEVCRFEVNLCGCRFQILRTLEYNMLPGSVPFSRGESLPRFTCSICDAKSGSDSSSSGKYRSSSELQSIGNTIIQNSTAASLAHSSLTGISGATEMTRHTSMGGKSASPSSSVSPTLSPDIKSASLMGCLTLRNFSILGFHLSPHLSSDVGECGIFIIKEILFDFICFLFSLRTITSIGGGTSLALASVYSPNRQLPCLWHHPFLLHLHLVYLLPPLQTFGSLSGGATGSPVLDLGLVNDGIPWRILQGVDRRNGCQRGSSIGPISDVVGGWGRISGKLYQMSRPDLFPFFFLFFHLYEALASISVFTFRRWIPEPGIQVSHPNAHRAGLVVFFYFFPMVGMISSEPGRLWLIRIQAPFSSEGLGLQAVVSLSPDEEASALFFPGTDILIRTTSGCLSRVGPPGRPLRVGVVCRGSGSPCNNSREVDTTKLNGSSGASSINNSVCQLDVGTTSQLDSESSIL
ncbi:hypothetical protein M5K25_000612 [Dendrobium thyrsiflorum]|uniref:Uncharacterized protein n=1 Tax=Dendrobium thyrsiflorum TaxID=117978 RepID=A0ABD0VWC4_DENTH